MSPKVGSVLVLWYKTEFYGNAGACTAMISAARRLRSSFMSSNDEERTCNIAWMPAAWLVCANRFRRSLADRHFETFGFVDAHQIRCEVTGSVSGQCGVLPTTRMDQLRIWL